MAESGKVCTERSNRSGCRKQERVEGRYQIALHFKFFPRNGFCDWVRSTTCVLHK